jgi:hypothetical protein
MWQVTTNKSHQKTSLPVRENGFVTGEWEVITTPQQQWFRGNLRDKQEQVLPISEIDELVEALGKFGNLKPEVNHSSPASTISPSIKETVNPVNYAIPSGRTAQMKSSDQNGVSAASRIINELAIPRRANVPESSPLLPEVREQLLKLRATIMVEAAQRQLRSVLICGATPEVSVRAMVADLSRLMAEYAHLKIAYIEVVEADFTSPRNKVLPQGYTFRIRRTRAQNLYEIASSQGAIRLDDWLKNWTPSVVLSELEKMFDLVLMCAPAVTSNPEVALLAGAVDGVVLVATENVTSFAGLGEAQQRLRTAQANVLGVTLNQAPSTPSPFSVVKSRMRGLMNFIAVIK